MNKNRYMGISIFGFLVIFLGIAAFSFSFFGVMIFEGKLTLKARIPLFVISLLLLLLGNGILKLKKWARKTIILASILLSFNYLIQDIIPLIFKKEKDQFFFIYVAFIFCMFLSPLIYFTRSKVTKLYQQKTDNKIKGE